MRLATVSAGFSPLALEKGCRITWGKGVWLRPEPMHAEPEGFQHLLTCSGWYPWADELSDPLFRDL